MPERTAEDLGKELAREFRLDREEWGRESLSLIEANALANLAAQYIRDAEAENQSVIDALRLTVADALDAIRQQAERYKAQCEAEDALDEKCAQLEKDKRDAETAQRDRDAPYRELHRFILQNCTCLQDGSGNNPCVLNEQTDTWCLYHKAVEIRDRARIIL